jgi:pilus assembly protein CpaB
MRRQAQLLLILALTAGGLAALLATRMVRGPVSDTVEADRSATVSVAVAARDMNVGTLLTADDIRLTDWPAQYLPAGYSTSASEVVGRGILTPVSTNEPLLSSKLASREAGGGMHIMIPGGKRAMSVRVDDVVGVAGFVLPGTRVDVIVTMERGARQGEPATQVVLQNLEVLSAGQSIERNLNGEPRQVSVVTLLVDPDQAEKLALAHSNARLQLALRNPMDLDSVSTPGIQASRLLAAPPAAPRVVPRSSPAPRPPSRLQVEVYRGPERTTSTVDPVIRGNQEGRP